MLIHQVFELIDGVNEIVLKESYKRPVKSEEAEEMDEADESSPEESS
jgi:hypothetical protein